MEAENALEGIVKLVGKLTTIQALAEARLGFTEKRISELGKCLSDRTKHLLESSTDQANSLTTACESTLRNFEALSGTLSDLMMRMEKIDKRLDMVLLAVETHIGAPFSIYGRANAVGSQSSVEKPSRETLGNTRPTTLPKVEAQG